MKQQKEPKYLASDRDMARLGRCPRCGRTMQVITATPETPAYFYCSTCNWQYKEDGTSIGEGRSG